jgi:hypothetical protein
VLEQRATGLPLGTLAETDGPARRAARRVDRELVGLRPTLFGYQHVLRLTTHAQGELRVEIS